ncbi:MAG: 30S ribosome-binding factor RbfA [Phycisphaeraceae bacterium]
MSHRIEQVESVLQRAISQVLQRKLSDPRIRGMVSVTRVKVSPDLHEAQVFVSVLPEQYEKTTLSGLRSAASHIHSLLRKQVALRSVPRLDFRLDESLKRQAELHEAINRGIDRSGDEEGEAGEEPGADESPEEKPGPDAG